jgi:hypothetical protein
MILGNSGIGIHPLLESKGILLFPANEFPSVSKGNSIMTRDIPAWVMV